MNYILQFIPALSVLVLFFIVDISVSFIFNTDRLSYQGYINGISIFLLLEWSKQQYDLLKEENT